MFEKILFLQPGELKRLLPFFGFYLILYCMMTLGDGISLSLFVNRVGADKLPTYYAITAVINFILVGLYFIYVDKISNLNLFKIILIGCFSTYLVAFCAVKYFDGISWGFGLFLINREISFTMVIIHFGNFLMDYFSRPELNRVLPIVYSGGRFGGILGGFFLSQFAKLIGVLNLVIIYLVLGAICIILLFAMEKVKVIPDNIDEKKYQEHIFTFLKNFKTSPFLVWFSISSLLYFITRTFLNVQYNTFFQHHFGCEIKMAEFIGYYSMLALVVSIVIQMFMVSRLINLIGLKGSFFIYNILFTGALFWNLFPMMIVSAVYSRFLEGELRLGFRNSVSTLITNKFPKSFRSRARAWSLGCIVPMATLIASVTFGLLNNYINHYMVYVVGFIFASGYLISTFRMYNTFVETPKFPIFEKKSADTQSV